MNKKEMRKNIVENMDKMVRLVEKEKHIPRRDEICIKKVRIDEKWNTMYIQYEGNTRIGFLLYNFVEKESLIINSWIYGDDIANSCRNLVHYGDRYWIKDKDIVEFRFRK